MSKNFRTFLKHTAKDYYNQSVNPPVVRASTIIFKTMNELRKTQKRSKKIQLAVILIMEDKELQQHLFCKKC